MSEQEQIVAPDSAGESGDLNGSFPALHSPDPLNNFHDDEGDDLEIPEKETLMMELSTTLNFTHMDRDLVAVDDTGMYALVSQMSKKIIELDKQVQNPPWFAKVMTNIER
jgi:hypothetical protein